MAYSGRRGPNVSEYIASLNAIPSAQDLQNSQDNFNLDDELAMFTNTQFFDFDLGQDADLQPTGFGVEGPGTAIAPENTDIKPLEFMEGHIAMDPDNFSFSDFSNPFPSQPFDSTTTLPPVSLENNQSLYPASSTAGSPPPTTANSASSAKRKSDSISTSPQSQSIEASSRLAAEEDKRRRNTAASARFRVKKKQREQALERSAKEMSDKVSALESRIGQLETENKWLKNLITEKNEGRESDIARLWAKFSAENAAAKGNAGKEGVGTKV